MNLEIQRVFSAGRGLCPMPEAPADEQMQDLSHDLRAPLAAAEGYLRCLLGGECGAVNEEQREVLETAVRGLERMQSLIDETLEAARRDAREGHMEEGDVVPVVGEVLEMFRFLARDKGVSLESRFEAPAARIMMDAGGIRRVLTNLIGNALKFTPRGGSVAVTLAARGGRLTVFVADTGCGIPEEALENVFARFTRAPQGRGGGELVPGNGLGLAIVKRVLEEHGGQVWVDSEVGAGTTVAFALPLAVRPQEALS